MSSAVGTGAFGQQTPLDSCRVSASLSWPLVLYFHHVHPTLDHYTNLTPSAFEYGLDTVLESFEPVSLESVLDVDATAQPPAKPSVLITFDDGYADLLDTAVPALAERGVPATFFVCTSLLGRRSADPRGNHLTWTDCADLVAAGHAIGSHGCTHRPLTELSPAEIDHEVRQSFAALRSRLGIDHAAYAYPYGLMSEIPERIEGFAGSVTAFGTVKAAARPWTDAPRQIRRTYLPTGHDSSWPELVRHWRRSWEG